MFPSLFGLEMNFYFGREEKAMQLSEAMKRAAEEIDCRAEEIIRLAEEIQSAPELGYKERKTAQRICEEFQTLSVPYESGLALTGVRGKIGSGDGVHICIIGEMDAVVCGAHPKADPKTGAAHACGHHAQLAAMMGALRGILACGAETLGNATVSFLAVPAEEYIDLEARRALRKEGKIRFFGGKQQLIYEGVFDDVDIAMMVHAQPNSPKPCVFVHGGSLGFLEKQITFHGKAAHASEPFDGVNALNAAALSILGIHANREHFREEDKIRIHPIITKGGDAVNVVPSEVCMDGYVRGASMPAILSAAADVDRTVFGAAQMLGARAEIHTEAGYLPLNQEKSLGELFRKAAEQWIPQEQIYSGIDMVGSTDMGDLSQLLPCIQPTVGGFDGSLHGEDFRIADPYAAYVLPAKILALTVLSLLENNAERAKNIKKEFQPNMSKEQYIEALLQTEKHTDGGTKHVD